MSPLEKNGQRASELLARFSQPRGLDLDVISQHEFLGIRMQVDLLVHPVGDLLVAVAIPLTRSNSKNADRHDGQNTDSESDRWQTLKE